LLVISININMPYTPPIFPFGNLLTLKGLPYYGVVKIVGYDYYHPEYTNLEGSISFKSQEVLDGGIGQWILGVNLTNTTNNFFSIQNAYNSDTPFVIDPNTGYVGINNNSPAYNLDVTGNSHTSQIHYVDERVVVSATNGNISVLNPISGSGLVLQGTGTGSTNAQLRIISNTAWTDNVETAYFQLKNDQNNNATFMGGGFGTDTQLSRLQLVSNYTTITDHTFTATPVPDSLLEIVASTNKRLLKLIGSSGQSSDYIKVLDSLGDTILLLDSSGNLTVSGNLLVTGSILSNNLPLARFVSTAPSGSTATGSKGDYYIDTVNKILYMCAATNTWIKITGLVTSF
jgi:hypothetical protein